MGSVPRLLTVAQAAKETGLARWRLYNLIASGCGPRVLRFGRAIRVSEVALIEWVATQERPGGES